MKKLLLISLLSIFFFFNSEAQEISTGRSKNSFVFGDGPPTPSIGIAKISIRGYVFDIDIVSCDIPGLIGMDILSRHYKNRGIFRLSLGGRKLMIDDEEINLLWGKRRSFTPPQQCRENIL